MIFGLPIIGDIDFHHLGYKSNEVRDQDTMLGKAFSKCVKLSGGTRHTLIGWVRHYGIF